MKRSPLVTVVIVLQALLGVTLAGLAIYLLAQTRSRETLAEPDAAGVIHGLLIGAAVLAIPAVITVIAVLGLWKGQFRGWLLSLATDVGILAVLVYNGISDHDWDTSGVALMGTLAAGSVLLLWPSVRKRYWNAGGSG